MLNKAKAIAKRLLAARARRVLRDAWEDLRDWIDAVAFGLRFVGRGEQRPAMLLYFGFALGDDLLCTAVLRELRRRGRDRLLMVSGHPELFAGNPDAAVWRPWRRYSADASTVSICRRHTRLWGGEFIRIEYAPLVGDDRSQPPERHIIAEMCARAHITGSVALRPYLHLTTAERAPWGWAAGRVVIQSSGLDARHPIRNKEWYLDRLQDVVDVLYEDVEFVQIGGASNPRLRHATDLRGKTGIRETAAILSHARLYVGTVGFLMHLARAVDCPSVIVYGGREAPRQSGYSCNLNLYSATPCAPCWRWNTCEYDRRCMSEISVSDVVSAIRRMLDTPRHPLAVDTVHIPSAHERA
jgi:Glycosyltransferase family 9 (heptosyltransferase)